MKTIYSHFIFLCVILISACQQETGASSETEKTSAPKLIWHWEDEFTAEEKSKIKKYITEVTEATFRVLGKYPFDVHYYFKRSNSKDEPIPWAYTVRRKNKQGVRFHINPLFSYDIIFKDWTAPHEISHLSIPFLGQENSWFAEGYASYMQYQIMQELGIYTKEEVNQKYLDKIKKTAPEYKDSIPFIENALALRSRYNFPAMYWGGAMFFIYIDSVLSRNENSRLNEVIRNYQTCCRNEDKNMEMLLKSLDKGLKVPVFMNTYHRCHEKSFRELFMDDNGHKIYEK